MRKMLGEYKEDLIKLFGSFRKKVGLKYNETSDYVDSMIKDDDYSIIYFASDITYTEELIKEINESGIGSAYGFYRTGDAAYKNIDEIKEAIPNIVGDGGNKFIFVEIEERSRFRLEDIPKTFFIKLGREKGNLTIDIIKAREIIEDEVIKPVDRKCMKEFNELYNTLYKKRIEVRRDLFLSNFKMNQTELYRVCDRDNSIGAFVCYKNDVMVGFVVYEVATDSNHRSLISRYYYTVRDIYVLEEYRRCGIATRLFREVRRIADKAHAQVVRFRTWGFDEETLGFVNSLNKKNLYSVYEVDV